MKSLMRVGQLIHFPPSSAFDFKHRGKLLVFFSKLSSVIHDEVNISQKYRLLVNLIHPAK